MPAQAEPLVEVEGHLRAMGESERAQRFQVLRESLDDANLRIVIFGEFSRGKSTLINALLGRAVLPAKLIPTTGHITRIVFGTPEEIRVRYVDGRMEAR
jgi:predicted GTPase